MLRSESLKKVGLGLRRELLRPLRASTEDAPIDFVELAPENWIGIGGKFKKDLDWVAAHYPIFCHGLSLSLGSPDPLDFELLKKIKSFLTQYNISVYSEHLSYCSAEGHLYDLLPLPFTEEAVFYVASRIRQVQDFLEQKIAIENISYYLTPPISEMSEPDFLNAVLSEANCELLLDVNNVYVNSINHGYSAEEFLRQIPTAYIRYLHIAGHYDQASDLKIDTHGSDVIEPVFWLLKRCYEIHGVFPTLLERDFNIPALETLFSQTREISRLQDQVTQTGAGFDAIRLQPSPEFQF